MCFRNFIIGYISCGLSYMAFVEIHSLYIQFVRGFIMNRCWILSNAFSASIEIVWLLPFILLIWCITFIYLWMLNHTCIPGINSTLLQCIMLLMYYWFWFANILFRIFRCTFFKDIGLSFFLTLSLSGFGIRHHGERSHVC